MATLAINIPDAAENRVINGVAKALGYRANIPEGNTNVPNPQTKKQFVKAHLAAYIKGLLKQAEQNEAAKAATDAASASVDAILID